MHRTMDGVHSSSSQRHHRVGILETNPYVIAADFSKAFESVKHILCYASLELRDHINGDGELRSVLPTLPTFLEQIANHKEVMAI